MSTLMVYVTTASFDEAQSISKAIVSEGLAACVNILPSVTSVFFWEGEAKSENETVFIAKSTEMIFPALKDRILDLHSYEVPCIVALPMVDGHVPFLDWISQQTTQSS